MLDSFKKWTDASVYNICLDTLCQESLDLLREHQSIRIVEIGFRLMGRKKKKSDEALLQIARQCFLQLGPYTPTRIIAQAADVSQATLFNRFNNKQNLLVQALAPQKPDNIIEWLSQRPDSRPIPQQLFDVGQMIYAYMKEVLPALAILQAASMNGMFFDHYFTSINKHLQGWVQIAQQSQRITQTFPLVSMSILFLGSIIELTRAKELMREKESDIDEQIKKIIELLWNGAQPYQIEVSRRGTI